MPVKNVGSDFRSGGAIPGTTREVKDGIAATQLRGKLVALNAGAKIGTRTISFHIGRAAVQTDEALRALQSGKKVKATVVEFKGAHTGKMTGGAYYKAKVRVPGVKISFFDDVASFAAFAKKNVFDQNAKATSSA